MNSIRNCPQNMESISIELPYSVTFVWFWEYSFMSTFQSDFSECFNSSVESASIVNYGTFYDSIPRINTRLICLRLAVQYAR